MAELQPETRDKIKALADRIKELNDKATQILLFLSFALVMLATLGDRSSLRPEERMAINLAMRWWIRAIWPILGAILPLKEVWENNACWYQVVRGLKILLLWLAVVFIGIGLCRFAIPASAT